MNTTFMRVVGNLLKSESGRRHPVRVLTRFAHLQLRRRLWPRPFSFKTVTGTRAFVDSRGDFAGITALYYFDLPNLQETAFACHCLRAGDVFWDIGANQGFWSLLLAGRGVECHAFEPAAATFANQVRQFSIQQSSHRDRIHGHNIGFSSRSGKMRLTADRGQANFLLKEEDIYPGEVTEAEVTTVDAFCKQTRPPNLIKIDVEGWNSQVLAGASATLQHPELRGLVIETFRFADGGKPELRAIEDLLAGFGFTPFRYDPIRRSLHPLVGLTEGGADTIYARNTDGLRALLRSAEPVTCFGDRF
jgi:FkbM family methyltransferase